ncbi:DUF6477 family protein [Paracoccus ravus]|uniref:DUF6477 family protein n=1 Tax=Paracoccus ravus TaxID=2447760 RepID=UPI002468AA1C|nr:DUF6477 family protein [Paracoccus ravus]
MLTNVVPFRKAVSAGEFRRPPILLRTARSGMRTFNRARELPRLLGGDQLCAPAETLPRLRQLEARQDELRRAAEPGYDLHRHVMLLIAILAETALANSDGLTLPGTAIRARP